MKPRISMSGALRTRAFGVLFGLGLISGLNGCTIETGEDLIGEHEQPIVNGILLPKGIRGEVGRLLINGKWCTATMFTNKHFLTAAHCIDYAGSVRGGALGLEGTAPSVDRKFSLGRGLPGQHDLAVGQLVVAQMQITPANIGFSAPDFDTTITQIGMGCTNPQAPDTFGKLRYLTFTRNSNGNVGCAGDSGGPAFLGNLTSNGDLVLVDSGRLDRDVYADPGLHRAEIYGLANALGNDGICYRVHAADIGWMPAVCNGAVAGTIGQSRTLYAVQIWSNRPGVSVCYKAYLSNVGWQDERCDSDMAGTLGQADKGIQALQVRLRTRLTSQRLSAKAHVSDLGWQAAVGEGQSLGIPGSGRRLEAFTISTFLASILF